MYYCYRVVITAATALHTTHHCCPAHCCYPAHSCPARCCPMRCCPARCCPTRCCPARCCPARRRRPHHCGPLRHCCCHAPPPLVTHRVSRSSTIHRRLSSTVDHPLSTVIGQSSSSIVCPSRRGAADA